MVSGTLSTRLTWPSTYSMSDRLAAGWALPSDHSVSVVPMIQCRPHGITNSTLSGVRTMIPVLAWIRSRGTTR